MCSPLAVLKDVSSPSAVSAVCFVEDLTQEERESRSYLVTGNESAQIQIWDLDLLRVVARHDFLDNHEKDGKDRMKSLLSAACHISSLQQLPLDGEEQVFIGCQLRSGLIVIISWNSVSKEFTELQTVRCGEGSFAPLQAIKLQNPQSGILLACSDETEGYDGTLALHYASSGQDLNSIQIQLACKLKPHIEKPGQVFSLKLFYINSTLYLLVGYEIGLLSLWTVSPGPDQKSVMIKCDHQDTLSVCDGKFVSSLDYYHAADNGGMGTCGSPDKELIIFTLATESDLTSIQVIQRIELTNPGLSCSHFRPDGRLFATGGWDGRVRLFSTKKFPKCRPLAVITEHGHEVSGLCWSGRRIKSSLIQDTDGGHILVSCARDGKIALYSAYNT